jgi:flagellar biosynthesis protein FlhA
MIDPASGQPMIEPDLARTIGERVTAVLAERNGASVALIVQPRLRRTLAALLRLRAPGCVVLSISELPETQPVEVIAVVGGEPPPQLGLPSPASDPARQPAESMAA